MYLVELDQFKTKYCPLLVRFNIDSILCRKKIKGDNP